MEKKYEIRLKSYIFIKEYREIMYTKNFLIKTLNLIINWIMSTTDTDAQQKQIWDVPQSEGPL